jgi:hypothetical protein
MAAAVAVAGSTDGPAADRGSIAIDRRLSSVLPHAVPEEPAVPIALLPAALAEDERGGQYIVIVQTSGEFSRWLRDPGPGADGLQVEGLISDPEVWALAAQGAVPIPIDVVLSDPASEFSALYRLVDVRMARPVRVTIPARPGFLKALRLAASLQLPVRLLPGQPGPDVLAELTAAAQFYLHDPMVEAPVEFFHSVFAVFRGMGGGTLWGFLEQDPAVYSIRDAAGRAIHAPDFVATHLARLISQGAECAACPWQTVCAGYFKWPDPAYDCAGVKELFAALEAAAGEITRDLASEESIAA